MSTLITTNRLCVMNYETIGMHTAFGYCIMDNDIENENQIILISMEYS